MLTERLIFSYFTEADIHPEVMRYFNGGITRDRVQIHSEILPILLKYYIIS